MWTEGKQIITNLITKQCDQIDKKIIYDSITRTIKADLGDLTLPCFIFVKVFQNKPTVIAQMLEKSLTTTTKY